jgi:hypothetical protein
VHVGHRVRRLHDPGQRRHVDHLLQRLISGCVWQQALGREHHPGYPHRPALVDAPSARPLRNQCDHQITRLAASRRDKVRQRYRRQCACSWLLTPECALLEASRRTGALAQVQRSRPRIRMARTDRIGQAGWLWPPDHKRPVSAAGRTPTGGFLTCPGPSRRVVGAGGRCLPGAVSAGLNVRVSDMPTRRRSAKLRA